MEQIIEIVEKRPAYKKPKFEKTRGMTLAKEIIQENFNGSRYCLQCSSCHGCR